MATRTIHLNKTPVGGIDADTTAWESAVIANGGTVSSGRKTIVNNVITSLKSASLWTPTDRLYLPAAENTASALTCLKSLSLATGSGLTHTVDQGYVANNNPLDLKFNPTTAGSPGFVQNSASIFAWSYASGTDGGGLMGYQTTSDTVRIFTEYVDHLCYWAINEASPGQSMPNSGGAAGLYMVSRTGVNQSDLYINGTGVDTSSAVSTAPLNELIMGFQDDGLTNTAQKCSAFGIAAGFNSTQAAAYYSILRTYMTAVGVP